jgi:hypothetical protein
MLGEMSYSPREYVGDCERAVAAAKLIAEHYPTASREKIRGQWEWAHGDALGKATGFTVDVVEKKGDDVPAWMRFVVTFYPYHELRDGEAVARVYAAGWCESVSEYSFMDRLKKRPDLHAAILAMLKEKP